MDMLTLNQLAQLTDLALPTVRRYLDDYILYVPSVRVEGTIGFPGEAVSAVQTIHALTEAGHSHARITAELEVLYPITVITSQPLGEGQELPPLVPTISALLQDVDERYRALFGVLATVQGDLANLPSDQRVEHIQQLISSTAATTFHHFDALESVPADLVQIKQAIGVLASRLERSTSVSTAEQLEMSNAIAALSAQVTTAAAGPASVMATIRAEFDELRQVASTQMNEASETTAFLLRPELDALRLQIAEMRQERGQMLSLMTALQDNLVQLHMELADARHQTQVVIQSSMQPGQTVPRLTAVPAPVEMSEDGSDPGTDKLRTPRRLGHITGR